MTESSEAETVRLEVADGVGIIRLDRPPMNALDRAMQGRLAEITREVATRRDIAAVVVTGGDRVFAAGADIKEMARMSYADMSRHSVDLQAGFTALAQLPQPVVAAVNGFALGGGCELALCADIRIAADDATLGQPEIKLGLIPGAGGTQRLARLVGPARAKDLILTGRFVLAAEALAIGLVDQVVPAADVFGTALGWARQFVGGPALALRAAKQCVDTGLGLDLSSGLELERTQFAALFATTDREIGMRAFLDRTQEPAPFVGD